MRGRHDGRGAGARGGGEPLARAADACRIERSFACAEEDAQDDEEREGADEAGEHLRRGPEDEASAENLAGAGAIEQADERELRDAVGEGERGEEPAHLRGVEMHLGADGGVGDGERGAVEEVDHAREEEQRERDGLVAAQGAAGGFGHVTLCGSLCDARYGVIVPICDAEREARFELRIDCRLGSEGGIGRSCDESGEQAGVVGGSMVASNGDSFWAAVCGVSCELQAYGLTRECCGDEERAQG